MKTEVSAYILLVICSESKACAPPTHGSRERLLRQDRIPTRMAPVTRHTSSVSKSFGVQRTLNGVADSPLLYIALGSTRSQPQYQATGTPYSQCLAARLALTHVSLLDAMLDELSEVGLLVCLFASRRPFRSTHKPTRDPSQFISTVVPGPSR